MPRPTVGSFRSCGLNLRALGFSEKCPESSTCSPSLFSTALLSYHGCETAGACDQFGRVCIRVEPSPQSQGRAYSSPNLPCSLFSPRLLFGNKHSAGCHDNTFPLSRILYKQNPAICTHWGFFSSKSWFDLIRVVVSVVQPSCG